MTITTKQKVIISVVVLSAAYASGRWASPTKIVTKTQTVEVQIQKDKTQTDTNRDKHTKTVVQELRKPDGTVEKTTTVTQDDTTERKTNSVSLETDSRKATSDKEVTYSQAKVTISALGGLSFHGVVPQTVYGASISKPIFGPVTVGGFYLSNQTAGVSIGLTF